MKLLSLFKLNTMSNSKASDNSDKIKISKNFVRTSLMIREDLLEKLSTIAFLEKEKKSRLFNEALDEYLKDYEKEFGTIPKIR